MKSFTDLTRAIHSIDTEEKAFQNYKTRFMDIARSESPEVIENFLRENPDSFFIVAPILTASWFIYHRYQEIFDLLREVDLTGQNRSLDFFNGKLVKYFYLSLKHLGHPVEPLYRILATNKEYGNEYSVAVATNAILDYQINCQIYEPLSEKITDTVERSKYCIYHGIIQIVAGNYRKALEYLDEADILNTSTRRSLLIKKYTILGKLLLGECMVFYPYENELRPYFSLIGCVKRGDIQTFYRLLEEHKDEYFQSNVYFIVRRLSKNITEMGLRKIAKCYSRISVKDISQILGTDVEYLIYKTIKDGHIRGYIQDGIFYSQNDECMVTDCGESIRRAVEVRKQAGKMMKYPEIVPLRLREFVDENKSS